jgi:hypothetical protein
MGGVIAADAGDAPLRPGCVELDAFNIVDDSFHALLGCMLDCAPGIFDGCFTCRNETIQPRWNFFVGASLGVGLALLVAQMVCQRAVQVNDFVILPSADPALRTKKNDFHQVSSLLAFDIFVGFNRISRSGYSQ